MNKERLLALADRIEEAGDDLFFMPAWFAGEGWSARTDEYQRIDKIRECGTAACFGGWAVLEFMDNDWLEFLDRVADSSEGYIKDIPLVARYWLDLTMMEADWLFHGGALAQVTDRTITEIMDGDYRPTAVEASKTLRMFVEGELEPDEDMYKLVYGD